MKSTVAIKLAAIIATAVTMTLAAVIVVDAHETREAEQYEWMVGFMVEPAYEEVPSAALGLTEGATIGPDPVVANSFVFGRSEGAELVWGFTTLNPAAGGHSESDAAVQTDDLLALLEGGIGNSSSFVQEKIPIPTRIGDAAVGLRAVVMNDEDMRARVDALYFRSGVMGAYVFMMYPNGEIPTVAIADLARLMAARYQF